MKLESFESRKFGTVHFDSYPKGADIYVDGSILINEETEESIKTPTTVKLIEGRHDIVYRLHGANDISFYVDVLPDTNVNIHKNILSEQRIEKTDCGCSKNITNVPNSESEETPNDRLFTEFMRESGENEDSIKEYMNHKDENGYRQAYELYKEELGEIATIMVTRPEKNGDATVHTYKWGGLAVKMARDYGYNVIDIQKNDVNYEFVTKMIKENQPDVFIHFGHGCPSSLQGQNECIVTRKWDIDSLLDIAKQDPERFNNIISYEKKFGLLGNCKSLCNLNAESKSNKDIDICNPLCVKDTNLGDLKGSIIYANACWSAYQLGRCAEKYGILSYTGYNDLYMFPVDSLGTQNIFGEIQLSFLKSLLLGKTVGEAEQDQIALEDSYIRKYKHVKYISLVIIWNKHNRRITGDRNALIYSSKFSK